VFCLVSVKRWRKNDAVRNAAGEDFAGDSVAFDAARGTSGRKSEEIEEKKEVKKRAEGRSNRS
jgi:hypothetical protein